MPLNPGPRRSRAVPVEAAGPPPRRKRAEATEVVELLRHCPLLFGTGQESLERVAALSTLIGFRRREHVFAEGEPSRGLWILIDGRVRVFHSDAEGRQVVVGFPAPCAPIDLSAALRQRLHTFCAVALEPSRLLFLPQPALAEIAGAFPETVRNTIQELCRDLRQQDISHAVLSVRNARGRISCVLLQLAMQHGLDGPGGVVTIDYPVSRKDLADRSGMVKETASRLISDLQREGLIATRGSLIDILDPRALEGCSDCGVCEMDCSVFGRPEAEESLEVC